MNEGHTKHTQCWALLTSSSPRDSRQQNKTSWRVGDTPWMHCVRKSKELRWDQHSSSSKWKVSYSSLFRKLRWTPWQFTCPVTVCGHTLLLMLMFYSSHRWWVAHKHEHKQSITMSLLFFLALQGSVNHEVGEVNVAVSLFCLKYTDGTAVSLKTCQTNANHFLTTTPAVMLQNSTSSIFCRHAMVTHIQPVNQTRNRGPAGC